MAHTLGICINNPDNLGHAVGLCRAAHRAGVPVEVFLTGDGVRATLAPAFAELLQTGRVTVCEVSHRARGLPGEVPGLTDKDFVTQARNAEMVEDCDRYVLL